MTTYFISAIDTEVGKTIATGLLGRHLCQQNNDVITMKISQTGCPSVSEDIQQHRQLMAMPWQDVDTQGLTCPYLFPYPASPHLAAALADQRIDIQHIESALASLEQRYETVLLEGVGGLMVPLTEELLLIDWLTSQSLPIILVTSGKLGSINHTLLSLAALQQRGLSLYGMIYNHYPDSDMTIGENTRLLLKKHSQQAFPNSRWGEIAAPTGQQISDIMIDSAWFE